MDGNKERPRTESELKKKLEEQIGFLQRTADDFDAGHIEEAVRLAATLRLLLHDTGNSKSLLGQLSMKSMRFYDTSSPYDPCNLSSYGGLVCLSLGPSGPRYVAMLDDVREKIREVTFSEWWNNIIFVDNQKRTLSRKELILTAANQDGGAHVDSKIDETYAALSKDGALGWRASDKAGERPIEQPECAAIRQMAHEILKSLIPGYTKKPILNALSIISNVSLTEVDPATHKKIEPTSVGRKIGRNEPCPCGSKKKYKKCHGR